MTHLQGIFYCVLVLALPTCAVAAEVQNETIRQELLERARTDQEARRAKDRDAIRTVDEANTERLKEIVRTVGWPTQTMVGKDGETAAFLLVQHADRDKDFQVQALALME